MWEEAQKALLKDKYIGPLIRKYGDCDIKPRRYDDYFQHLCGSIISQQLSGKAADVIFRRFKDAVGEIKPKNVLKIDDRVLRNCGLSWAKVGYIKDLALKSESGELKTEKLGELSDVEVERELMAVKGIGRWSAQMFLMFTLAGPDVFPSGDLGIKNGLKKLTGKKLGVEEMNEFADRWKPYRTIASWYIWRSLDNR